MSARAAGGAGPGAGALAALVIGDVAFAFQQTAVVPALPTIERELDASAGASVWLLTGYLVVAATSGPLLGKLGDRHGKRRLLLIALGAFLAGSVGAALAPSTGWLIASRLVQGLGGAVFPLTQAIARDELPPERAGVALGYLTGAFGLGAAAGIGATGVVVEALSWRWVFALGAVVVAAAAVLVARHVPASRSRGATPLDPGGALLLCTGLAAVLLAITEGARLGFGAPAVAALGLGGLGALGLWARHELRAEAPLVDLRALARPAAALANAATFVLGYVLFGVLFLVPHLVEADPAEAGYGFGAGAAEGGLYLLPLGLAQVVSGPVGGRFGARLPLAAGLSLAAAAAGLLAGWHDEAWQLVLATLLLGTGIGLSIGPATALVAAAVPEGQTGVATALNSVVRRIGGSVGGQIGAALLAAGAVAGAGAPEEWAFTAAFAAMAVLALAGTACALLVPREVARRVDAGQAAAG